MIVQGGQQFCYLFIKYLGEAIIGLILGALVLILLFYSVKQFRLADSINMLNRIVKLIYISIFFWGVTYVLKILCSQTVYWYQIAHWDDRHQGENYYQTATKIVFGIDLITVFFLQAALLLTCYNWMDNIVKIFSQISNLEDSSKEAQRQTQKLIKFEKFCTLALRVYLFGRFSFFGILIAFFCIIGDNTIEFLLYQVMMILLIGQALLVVAIIILGGISIKKNDKLKQIVNEDQLQLMLRKYYVFLVCAIVRFVIDIIYFIKSLNDGERFKKQCIVPEIDDNYDNEEVISIINIILEGFLTHCLVIFVILKMFKISKKNVDLTQSLLAAEQYNQSTSDDMVGKDRA